jgi:hypothetical protein
MLLTGRKKWLYATHNNPEITKFSITASGGTSTSLTVPVSITAIDDTAVTGYAITETPEQPQPNFVGWGSSLPSSYTITGKTVTSSPQVTPLYAWAKDINGNVSGIVSDWVTIQDATPILTPVAPANSATNVSQPITFSWTDMGMAEYNIQVATDSGFVTVVADQTVSATSVSINGLASGTTHYWRVRGHF